MKSQTRLSDFTLTFHFHALEKAMATRSSVLAWKIPWTEEPGGLPSVARRTFVDPVAQPWGKGGKIIPMDCKEKKEKKKRDGWIASPTQWT